jgi:hypothetical protein
MGQGGRYFDGTDLLPSPRTFENPEGPIQMVERRIELDRRYRRKAKMRKLKSKLARTQNPQDRDKIIGKIHVISPFWQPPAATPKA